MMALRRSRVTASDDEQVVTEVLPVNLESDTSPVIVAVSLGSSFEKLETHDFNCCVTSV
ncbi:unnamed protein product, partial [Rotaria magnacalcarata]